MGYTRVYWGTVGALALLGLVWRLAYIGWRDYLPVRVAVDCGVEQMQRGEATTMDRRDCLWQAYRGGRTARLVVQAMTVLGPRVTTLTVAGPERVRIRWEATDERGQMVSGHDTCAQLVLQPDPPRPSYFRLTGCTGKYGEAAVGYFGEGDPVRGG